MLGEDHDKTRKYLPRHVEGRRLENCHRLCASLFKESYCIVLYCHAQAFCIPVYPAVLLRKLTNNYKTFLSLSSEKNVSRKVYKRIEIRVYKVNMSSNRHI